MENKKYGHLMLDIETMGTKSNSLILSIAAVEFNIESGKTNREFEGFINPKSSLELGFDIDAETLMWWLEQSDDARSVITKKRSYKLDLILDLFTRFCGDLGNDFQIWGNSARFDCGLLQDAYNKLGLDIPWGFWNERDVRTLVSFAPEIKKAEVFTGIKHNAIDDCKFQISYCSKIWNKLNVPSKS